MKKAFGVLELLIVVIIIIIIYYTCFHSGYGRPNPFDDNAQLNSAQELADEKIEQIENAKALRQKIENNLNEGN